MATEHAQRFGDVVNQIAKEMGVSVNDRMTLPDLMGIGRNLIQNSDGSVTPSSLGYRALTTTMTYVNPLPIRQEFYTLFAGKKPSDFVPIDVGVGAWATEAFTRLTYSLAGDYEAGYIGVGSGANDRTNYVDMGASSKTVARRVWKKGFAWTIADLAQAGYIQGFDLIGEKMETMNEHFALGQQELVFLGSKTDALLKGLYTLSDVNSDTAAITKSIASMSFTELNTAAQAIIEYYRANCSRTAYFTHFIVPESDWNGLQQLIPVLSGGAAFLSRKQILEVAFKGVSGLDVQIMPTIYGMPTYNASRGLGGGSGLNRYVAYKYDKNVLRQDMSVPLMMTNPGTIDNFQFQCAGVSQHSGVAAFKPTQICYFDFAA